MTQLSIPENALVVKETRPFTSLCFATRTTLPNLPQYAPGVAENLYEEVVRLNLSVVGPIQWIYTGMSNDPTQEFKLEISLPIAQTGVLSDKFLYKEFPAFRCATYTYTGPWSNLASVYGVLFNQLYQLGYQHNGYVREVYNGIDLENQANCVTEIQIGVM